MNKFEKLVVVVAILSSLVAFLDSSIVNVALPAMQRNLGGGLITQQWVVDAYLLTLGSFILIAGSLSDLFGRKRLLVLGLVGFGAASLLCALAPKGVTLIIFRAAQGLFGALLVPSSLALITAFLSQENFSHGIGQWTSWTSIAFVIGPLLGGFLTDNFSWRWIFAINIVPILITLSLIKSLPPEKRDELKKVSVDFLGAALCALGLGGIVFALIEQPALGFGVAKVYIPLVLGIFFLILFFWRENKTTAPMLPLAIFRHRNFSAGNLATLFIYSGLSVVTFIVVIYLQQTAHFTALTSGLSLIPITLILFLLSPFVGKMSHKYGSRWFMTFGPLLASLGIFLMGKFTVVPVHYWTQIFPGVLIFGLGLATTVSPLTSTILGDVEKEHSGIASAINNAVARIAGLLAIATIGLVAASFSLSLYATAACIAVGGIISAIGIQNKQPAVE